MISINNIVCNNNGNNNNNNNENCSNHNNNNNHLNGITCLTRSVRLFDVLNDIVNSVDVLSVGRLSLMRSAILLSLQVCLLFIDPSKLKKKVIGNNIY